MSGVADPRLALLARLTASAPGCALASNIIEYPNKAIINSGLSRWYRATFLPGIPRPAAIGSAAQNRQVGVFQIDVFTKTNVKDDEAANEAERIAQCYKRGTILTANGQTVMCKNAYRTPGGLDGAWYMISVIVEWWADVDN